MAVHVEREDVVALRQPRDDALVALPRHGLAGHEGLARRRALGVAQANAFDDDVLLDDIA